MVLFKKKEILILLIKRLFVTYLENNLNHSNI